MFVPFHASCDPVRKFAPFTVIPSPPVPRLIVAIVGLTLVTVGAGFLTMKLCVPPLHTQMFAWIVFGPTYVVPCAVPSMYTLDDVTNPPPLKLTFRLYVPELSSAICGLIPEMYGVGFGVVLTIVNGNAFDVPPPVPGVNTVTCAVPAAARSLAGIVAVRVV